jgi:transcription initiation factor IIE alpha subunit
MTIKHCPNCGAKLDEQTLKCQKILKETNELVLVELPGGENSLFDIDYEQKDLESMQEIFFCDSCGKDLDNMEHEDAVETLRANTPNPNE